MMIVSLEECSAINPAKSVGRITESEELRRVTAFPSIEPEAARDLGTALAGGSGLGGRPVLSVHEFILERPASRQPQMEDRAMLFAGRCPKTPAMLFDDGAAE